MVSKEDLIAFEDEVARAFEAGKIRAPIHLSGGNEDQLIEVFQNVGDCDFIFSTWRSHYHALLHGVPRQQVMDAILAGKSMYLNFPKYGFYAGSIVAGMIPIALGKAAAIKRSGEKQRVWCFVGDMAARTGIFMEARQYADGHDLPIEFVVENNGLSTNTDTVAAWGDTEKDHYGNVTYYGYTRQHPHVGTGKRVSFV